MNLLVLFIPVAIEEFEELKGRYEFLTKQQSDILTAREAFVHHPEY